MRQGIHLTLEAGLSPHTKQRDIVCWRDSKRRERSIVRESPILWQIEYDNQMFNEIQDRSRVDKILWQTKIPYQISNFLFTCVTMNYC